jgi:hypothetical protein
VKLERGEPPEYFLFLLVVGAIYLWAWIVG